MARRSGLTRRYAVYYSFDGPFKMAKWAKLLIETAPDRDVAEHVLRSLQRLLAEDVYLFEADANERSISHRLALYLEEEFPGWNVDCEYNRNGHEPKRLQLNPEEIQSDDEQGTTVYPDIIVHRRGQSENHLVIEIKKRNGGSCNNDLRKLRALRKELGYTFALFLRFQTEASAADIGDVLWIVD